MPEELAVASVCLLKRCYQSSCVQSYRFTRASRLLIAREFGFVFDSPAYKAGNDHFLILARENELDRARVGFVFSKKNARLATSRNMLRRMCREEFRLRQNTLPAVDIVVLTRRLQGEWTKAAVALKFAELLTRIQSQYGKKHRSQNDTHPQ